MSEKLCVVCLKVSASSVGATVYELDDPGNYTPTPLGIQSGADRPAVHPENLGLCSEHHKYYQEGLVAVIEVETVRNQEEYHALVSRAEGRTGNMLYLPKDVLLALAEFPPNNAVVFCEREPFELLKEVTKDLWS